MKIRMSELIELIDHSYEKKINLTNDQWESYLKKDAKIVELEAKIDYMAGIIANIGEKDE